MSASSVTKREGRLSGLALDGDLLTRERARLIVVPSPFDSERIVHDAPAGHSIEEMVREALGEERAEKLNGLLIAQVEGTTVERRFWGSVRPKAGTITTIKGTPRGGMRGIFQIFIAIAAIAVQFIPGLQGWTLALASLAIGVIGNLALNFLFPIRPPSLPDQSQEQRRDLYSFGGFRNEARPFQPIRSVLGRVRVYADLGSRPYTEIVGDDQYIRALFIWGYAPLVKEELKQGETLLSDFDDVEIEHGISPAQQPTLVPAQVFEEPLSIDLEAVEGEWQQRTTEDQIDEISYDFLAPRGLLLVLASGRRWRVDTLIEVRYRLVGAGSWTSLPTVQFSGKTTNPLRIGRRHVMPTRGQYDVAWRFTIDEDDRGGDDDTLLAQVLVTALRGFRNDPPITSTKPLEWTAIRMKATGQLNGTLDAINAICTSKVTAWNGSAWVEETASQNPADLIRWALQGPANARPYADAKIALDVLEDFHAHCVTNGWKFNMERTSRASVMDLLADICSAAFASPSIIDGKQGVIWDQPDAPIVQHFTPRNSSSFRAQRAYRYWPHAWRARFRNEDMGFEQDERIVYDDGYNAGNATRFEGIEFPGVTDTDLVWKLGRRQIAQARLRPEEFSVQTDFEHLVCTRGDRVLMSYDVPLVGIQAARVKAVEAALPQTVTLDERLLQESGKNYAVRFRLSDGSTLLRSVTTIPGESATLRLTGSGSLPVVGDLAMYGESGLETIACRVKGIVSLDDFAARVVLVDDAPAISTADSGDIPAYSSNITLPPDPLALAPLNVSVREFLYAESDGTPREAAHVSWQVTRFGITSAFEVQVREVPTGEPFRAAGSALSPLTFAEVRDLDSSTYVFRVRALFSNNKASAWAESEAIFLGALSEPPPDVENFRISVLGANATLTWDTISSLNVSHYRIKFHPASVGATWGSAQTLIGRAQGGSAQVAARSGTYFIKAVSPGETAESANAASIVTNIAILANMNVVELVEEHPDFLGDKERVIFDTGLDGLRLDDASEGSAPGGLGSSGGAGFFASGYYYLSDFIDLQAVFTSRVTITLEAYGINLFDDFFANDDFFDPDDFFDIDPADWLVRTEIALTEDDPAGSSPTWTEWAEYVLSDYTARAFDVRFYFESRRAGLTPIVVAITVEIDMPDRVEGGNDLVVPVTGSRIDFTPPFLVLAGLGIAAQDLQPGERYNITYKDETGFNIIFRNQSETEVERTFDFVAKGYGRRIT